MYASQLINIGSKSLKNKKILSHQIDTEIILSHILCISREQLLIHDKKIQKNTFTKFKSLISRRLRNEPIAYIINKKEFRSQNLYVDNNSLIPRPETELLIDPIVEKFKNKKLFFLDIGVGSGCIISSILRELPNSFGVGIDISRNALLNAHKNLNYKNINNRYKLYHKSADQIHNKIFDLIISNPPYIVKRDLERLDDDIKKFEPRSALDGGNDGLDVIKKIIYKSKYILRLNGILALEIGNGQYLSVRNILKKNNFRVEQIIKDYKNNVRCIISTLLKKNW